MDSQQKLYKIDENKEYFRGDQLTKRRKKRSTNTRKRNSKSRGSKLTKKQIRDLQKEDDTINAVSQLVDSLGLVDLDSADVDVKILNNKNKKLSKSIQDELFREVREFSNNSMSRGKKYHHRRRYRGTKKK